MKTIMLWFTEIFLRSFGGIAIFILEEKMESYQVFISKNNWNKYLQPFKISGSTIPFSWVVYSGIILPIIGLLFSNMADYQKLKSKSLKRKEEEKARANQQREWSVVSRGNSETFMNNSFFKVDSRQVRDAKHFA